MPNSRHCSQIALCFGGALLASALLDNTAWAQPLPSSPEPAHELESPSFVRFLSQVGWANRKLPEQPKEPVARSIHNYELDDVRGSTGANKVAPVLTMNRSVSVNGTDGSRRDVSVGETYRNMKIGQVVPMLGAIYRVVNISAPPNTLELERVTDPTLLREVGVAAGNVAVVPDNSFGLRSGPIFSGSSGGGVTISKVTPPANEKAALTAVASVHSLVKFKPTESWDRKREQELMVGDIVPIVENYELVVEKIVPRDDDRHIVGWVEFRPRLVVEARK